MSDYAIFINTPWFRAALIAFFVLLGLGLVYLIYFSFRDKLIKRLEYSREFSDKGVYESEYVTLIETIRNRSFLPLFFIDVEAYVYNGMHVEGTVYEPKKAMQYFSSRFHLWPFMKIRRRHTVKCLKRGYYVLESAEIYYNKRVRFMSAPAELYVYPKVIPLGNIVQPSSTLQGESITTRRLIFDPFSLNGIRDYVFGDPFNSINFKATAKTGAIGAAGIKVNSRDYCSNRTLMVYLNFQTDNELSIPTEQYEPMMERGLSYAAAIIREAAYNGYRAGFAANCVLVTGEQSIRFPIESGELHLEEILKEMAKVRSSVGISFYSMMDADVRRGLGDVEIYVITSYVDELIDECIVGFQGQGNYVHILQLEVEETK